MLQDSKYYEYHATFEANRSFHGTTDEVIAAIGRAQTFATLALAAATLEVAGVKDGEFHE